MNTYEHVCNKSNPIVAKDTIIINGDKIILGQSGWYLDNIIADINDAGLKKISADKTNDNKLVIKFTYRGASEFHISSGTALEKLGIHPFHKKFKGDQPTVISELNKKYFIISQPKAGTYLCSNFLINLNLIATGMHIKNRKARIYDPKDNPKFQTKKEMRQYMSERTITKKTFDEFIEMIPENGFAVGHTPYDKKYISGLEFCKKILLLRPYEEHKESLSRFYGNSSITQQTYNNIELWKHEANTFVMTFDDMINCNVQVLDNLQKFLFGNIKFDSKIEMKKALDAPSLTKSEIR